MSETPYFLDVNVPMYAAGQEHPYKEACTWVLHQIADGELDVVIDTEIVQEILYRYGALRRWEVAVTLAESLMALVSPIYAVTADDLQLALRLFAQYGPQGLQARDVVHAAVMQNRGISTIISTDSHFDLLPEVRRLDPQTMYEAS